MKKRLVPASIAMAFVVALATAGLFANDHDKFEFQDDSIVLSRTVFTQPNITIGEVLPLGCAGGPNGSTNVNVPTLPNPGFPAPPPTVSITVPCGIASDNGEYPNLNDSHNVWNNSGSDGSFGVSSQIFLDNLSDDGHLFRTLPIPTDMIVTSFSSKSELALNRSVDGRSITFMGYVGGVAGAACGGTTFVSPTAAGLLDVSASSTPGLCDPTNPVVTSYEPTPGIIVPTAYYRAVAEVDDDGNISITPGNAYSGDNGRAAMKGSNGQYYMAGNDNSGNLGKKNLIFGKGDTPTVPGIELVNATGAETLTPGGIPPVPANIGMIGRLELISGDKAGKDTNFRGLRIYNNTLYVTKGSGGNGVNTVYQVGSQGTLPTGTAAFLSTVPITILPGFPTASSANPVGTFPFGIWFADADTLYVCDEGDGVLSPPNANGNVADASSLATAGLQKYRFINGAWQLLYILQDGLDIGVPYNVKDYPTSLNPATGGCRNIAGRHNDDGTVTIYAITSTISANGDTGADPNKLVRVTDRVSDNSLPVGDGDHDRDDRLGRFKTIRAAKAGEAFRGVTLAPRDKDNKDHDHDGDSDHK
ncbi:MAG: hypothetical protein WAM91_08150 [Candidatus Acidiferrales bacterium]